MSGVRDGYMEKRHCFIKWAYATEVALVVKNPPANAGDKRDVGSIPGSGRSPGEGNGNHSGILA